MRWLGLAVLLVAGCGGTSFSTEGIPQPDADRPTDAAAPGATDAADDVDAGATDAGADAASGGRCQVSPTAASCAEALLTLIISGVPRAVHHQVPLGAAPPGGWPVVFLFQGSFFSAAHTFSATTADPFGAYQQTLTVKALLDGGFAVLAPEAAGDGSLYWDTNIPPWNVAFAGSPDDLFLKAMFAAIARGDFGPLDGTRLYAAGLSSGGYMTSRMAVSYPGRFRALAIESASYATCAAATCIVPVPLPSDHPPTLFLHGQLDTVVPISTMWAYHDELVREGRTSEAIVNPAAGHQWIAAAPTAVAGWFTRQR